MTCIQPVQGDEEALQDVGPGLRLFQLIAGAPENHLPAVLQEMMQQVLETEELRPVVDDGHQVDAEGDLHVGVDIQLVQDGLGQLILLEHDRHPEAFPVRFIPDVGNAFHLLVFHQLGDALDEAGLVHLVGQLPDDQAIPAALVLDVHLGPDADEPPAGAVGLGNALGPVDKAAGGEIRPRDDGHQFFQGDVRVVQGGQEGVADLVQAVGRDVGGHAHRNARGAVDQEVGQPGGHHQGLFQGAVVVAHEVHRVFVQVLEELVRQPGETHLGVTHGRGESPSMEPKLPWPSTRG